MFDDILTEEPEARDDLAWHHSRAVERLLLEWCLKSMRPSFDRPLVQIVQRTAKNRKERPIRSLDDCVRSS